MCETAVTTGACDSLPMVMMDTTTTTTKTTICPKDYVPLPVSRSIHTSRRNSCGRVTYMTYLGMIVENIFASVSATNDPFASSMGTTEMKSPADVSHTVLHYQWSSSALFDQTNLYTGTTWRKILPQNRLYIRNMHGIAHPHAHEHS